MNDQHSTLNSQPTVRLHIEQLILDGLPAGAGNARALQTGLEQELAHLLARTHVTDWSAQAVARLDTQPVMLATTGGSAAWGHQLARALMATLIASPVEQSSPAMAVGGASQIG